jgi:hypothetical protein
MNKSIIAALCVMTLSGCAVLPEKTDYMPKMRYSDLQTYRLECKIKDQQRKFLEGQKTNEGDKLVAGFARLSGDRDSYKIWDGSYNWTISSLLRQLNDMCH